MSSRISLRGTGHAGRFNGPLRHALAQWPRAQGRDAGTEKRTRFYAVTVREWRVDSLWRPEFSHLCRQVSSKIQAVGGLSDDFPSFRTKGIFSP